MSFLQGMPALGAHFYGRDKLLGRILASSGWTWVCAQRRMGKTSILHEMERRLRARGALVLRFDLANVPARGGLAGLLSCLLAEHEGELIRRGVDVPALEAQDPGVAFRRLVQKLLLSCPTPEKAHASPSLVLLWDEAERLLDVEQGNPGSMASLRAQLHDQAGLQIVIAATQLLTNLRRASSMVSTFLETFAWLPVCGLSDEESLALLRCERTGGWKTPLAPDIEREVLTWTGGHPFVLQEFGAQLQEECQLDGNKVDMNLLRVVQDHQVTSPNLRTIVRDDYAKLTPTQQQVLTSLCGSPGPVAYEDLLGRLPFPPAQIDDAIAFLRSYGYAQGSERIGLRYGFYRRLLPQQLRSDADTDFVERIGQCTLAHPTEDAVPRRGSLRRLLQAMFNDVVTFDAYCEDCFFNEVFKRFTPGMERTAKENLLLSLVQPQDVLASLSRDYPIELQRNEHLLRFSA